MCSTRISAPTGAGERRSANLNSTREPIGRGSFEWTSDRHIAGVWYQTARFPVCQWIHSVIPAGAVVRQRFVRTFIRWGIRVALRVR